MRLPNYIRYRVELRKQQKHATELRKNEPPDCETAHEYGQWAEYEHQLELSDQWLARILTVYYLRRAESLLVNPPDINDPLMARKTDWNDHPDEPHFMTELGLQTIKMSIREEEKHRREVAGFWLTSLTGLIGAAIGLISVWPKS
jgi:hypothetical protein